MARVRVVGLFVSGANTWLPCVTRTSTAGGSSDPVQPLALPILGADLEPIAFAHGCRDSGYENKDFVRMEMRTKRESICCGNQSGKTCSELGRMLYALSYRASGITDSVGVYW